MPSDSVDTSLDAYLRERGDLIALARSIVGSTHVAEELVQESWLRWAGRGYPADKSVPIFRRIVANLSKDWRRGQKVEQLGLLSYGLEPDQSIDAERVVMARQELAEIAAILSELPERTLIAFRMHRLEGKTYAQIGAHLGVGTTRVHQLLQNALVHVALRRDASN